MKSHQIISQGHCLWRRIVTLMILSFCFITVCSSAIAQTIWYVDENNSDIQDGTSWETAFQHIQPAIDQAVSHGVSESTPGEIWVAQGEYSIPNEESVTLSEHVHLYGGFEGTENTRDQRNWQDNITTVQAGSYAAFNGADNSVIDGFEFFRKVSMVNLVASPTIRNCRFYNHSDAVTPIYNHSSSPTISNCRFEQNLMTWYSAVLNIDSSPIMTDCVFYDNQGEQGGAISNKNSSPIISNCHFEENLASRGGALFNLDSNPIIEGSVLTNNQSDEGASIYNQDSAVVIRSSRVIDHPEFMLSVVHNQRGSLTLENCLFARNNARYNDRGYVMMKNVSTTVDINNCVFLNNETISSSDSTVRMLNTVYMDSPYVIIGDVDISYCCIPGGYPGEGNIDGSPMFWSLDDGDFRLHPLSSCLDAGTDVGAPESDVRGVTRPHGRAVDIGIYEMNETDTDSDGLYDDFEQEYSQTNPDQWDSDEDGTSDGEEWFGTGHWYVDSSSKANNPDGLSWESAFPDIQTAIDHGSQRGGGDLWISQGEYTSDGENVIKMKYFINLYGGFSGTEASREQRDWFTHPTIINGQTTNRGCTVTNNSLIDGVVFQDGRSASGSAVYGENCSFTLNNCSFIDNWTHRSGGAIHTRSCRADISSCWFKNSKCQINGGCIESLSSSLKIANCLFMNNEITTVVYDGKGSEIYVENGNVEIVNSTFYNDDYAGIGKNLYFTEASMEVRNCIVWGNEISCYLTECNLTNSCVEGWSGGGSHITTSAPLFWSPSDEDFRLHPASPCLDSATEQGAPDIDVYGTIRPQGSGVDMGAIEMSDQDSDGDGLFDGFEEEYSNTDPSLWDTDGDGVSDGEQWFGPDIFFVNIACQTQHPDGQSWETAYQDIQSAIDRAANRGAFEVWVAQGTYTGTGDNVVTCTQQAELYGGFQGIEATRDERDWDQYPTIIDGQQQRRGVDGGVQCSLDGFVISNGQADSGGGVYLLSSDSSLSNCIIEQNTASNGGGIYVKFGTPSISHSTIHNNSAESGGGLYTDFAAPSIINCSLSHNISERGGGIYTCNDSTPLIDQCEIRNNQAELEGGGVYDTQTIAEITRCILSDNSAFYGGGMYIIESAGLVSNCVMYKNTAGFKGGGLYLWNSGSLVVNCTISMNTSMYDGGGVYQHNSVEPVPTFQNSIIWYNGEEVLLGYKEPIISHCCIRGGFGDSNPNRPYFWNAPAGDFRLHPRSSCIDTGTTSNAPSVDVRGETRPVGSGIDLGAYETTEPDSDQDGLPDLFETEYSDTDPNYPDTDHDGLTDHDDWFTQRTWFVNNQPTDNKQDGKQWNTAFTDIQSAIDRASICAGGPIWVAQGTYTSTNSNVIKPSPDTNIYGGFTGDETSLSQRRPSRNLTIIDGEGIHRIIFSSYHVLVDGFTLRNGFAYRGGCIYSEHGDIILKDCILTDNSAEINGGAIYNYGATMVSTNCLFVNNSSVESACLFDIGSKSTLTNCTVSKNSSPYQSTLHFSQINRNRVSRMINCIVWDNTSGISSSRDVDVSYSCMQNFLSDEFHNINLDPMFEDPDQNNFKLKPQSPCIDMGLNEVAPQRDIRGIPRPQGNTVDMGAHEAITEWLVIISQ